MLGLTLLAVDCFITEHIYWGSFFFVLSISFKQMALYYAPIIFAYLLGLCVHPNTNIPRLVLLGATVIVSFGLVFAPLVVFGGKEQIAQCLFRVFPFARGLWEDKVANFWCAANILIKFRERFDSGMLQKASLIATFVAILPPCSILFFNPQKRLLPLGLAACAWGFFMFSFQVHEKSVLLPLVPTTLVLAGNLDKNTVSWVSWMNNVAMFSMWPLLRRDGLQLQYTVLTLLYAWLMGTFEHLPKHWFGKLVHVGSYVSILVTHFAEAFLLKGLLQEYPDLWVVANVEISFGCFTVAWIWVLWRLWKESRKGRKKPKRE
jgi:alpha-1,3-glucosyltransferase